MVNDFVVPSSDGLLLLVLLKRLTHGDGVSRRFLEFELKARFTGDDSVILTYCSLSALT